MKRIVLAVVGTVVVLVMLLGFKTSPVASVTPVAVAPRNLPPSTSASPPTSTAGDPPTPSTAPARPSTTPSATPKTYTGQVADTRYGPVQVQITLAGGHITNVQALQMPGGDPRDDEITQFSAPILAQEALAAQSAQIDVVSGATYTSNGYAQSLQSAIDQAHG